MNECLDCGCTCSSLDKWYACPIETLSDDELEKIFGNEKEGE